HLRICTLTVTKAPLTITADDQSNAYGDPMPALTANYAGFVNGDTFASLEEPIHLLTPATSSSPPGSYPITVTMNEPANYVLHLVNGTLTVTDSAQGLAFHSSRGNI